MIFGVPSLKGNKWLARLCEHNVKGEAGVRHFK
jgi:hypothetical protein